MKHAILLVDDDSNVIDSFRLVLEERGYPVESAYSGREALKSFRADSEKFALILLDYMLPDGTADRVIEEIRRVNSEAFIVVYSGNESREAVHRSWEAGAVAFYQKGSAIEPLLERIDRWYQRYEALQPPRLTDPNRIAERIDSIGMVGCSAALDEVARKVLRYRQSTQNVMIFGETGTGKELVARALSTSRENFVAVNCAAYRGNSDLLESELFGYERGAFTGANRDKPGIFEEAGDGVVFLDEVHHLSLTAQAKLLRVCQQRAIRRVGGSREYPIQCRLVTAAKETLEAMCDSGDFLIDLYHRLNVLPIRIPPLRYRPEDIAVLVDHFCKELFAETQRPRRLSARAMRILESYSWPGNVRELQNVVYQALTDCSDEVIGPEALDPRFRGLSSLKTSASYSELRERQHQEQKELVESMLKSSRSKTHAARRLGVSPTTLHSLIERLGIVSDSA